MSTTTQTQTTNLVLVDSKDLFNTEKSTNVPMLASPHELCPTHLKIDFYVFQEMVLGWIFRAIFARKHLMLVGPHGTGKSSHVVQTLIRLNMGFTLVKGSSDVEPSSLFGSFAPDGKGGFIWVDGPITIAARLGIPCLIEERDAILSDASVALNSVMDGMPIEIAETGERIIPKKGFFILATGNTAGQGDETGTHVTSKVQPVSSTSRFLMVKVDYMNAEDEIKVIKNSVLTLDDDLDQLFGGINGKTPSLDESLAEILVEYASATREAVNRLELTVPLSTRELEDIAKFSPFVPQRDGEKPTSQLFELLEVTYWNKLGATDAAVARKALEETLKIRGI